MLLTCFQRHPAGLTECHICCCIAGRRGTATLIVGSLTPMPGNAPAVITFADTAGIDAVPRQQHRKPNPQQLDVSRQSSACLLPVPPVGLEPTLDGF